MDYAMKNMKVSKAEAPLSTTEALVQGGPEYPYGLRITLAPEILKKLDLPKMPEVGQMLGLHAVVEVVSVSADRAANGSRDLRVELQITDMCLKDKSNDSMAKVAETNEKEYGEDETLLGKG